MKKKILFLILACLFSFGIVDDVYALSGRLTLTSNVTSASVGSKYNVHVYYYGDTVGTIRINTSFTNASCSIYYQAEGFTRNCTTSGCKLKFEDYANGYKDGTRLATFACTSNASPAKFSAAVIDNDAWDLNGENSVTVSAASKSIPITGTTTTTKKTTTTTKKSTTKSTTTTKKKTTTKAGGTTAKTTTRSTTTKKTTQTTRKTQNTTSTQSHVILTTPRVTTTTTTEVITTSIDNIPDDMKLSDLKIVGYEIDFNKNNTGYKIEVAKDVTEIFVIATPIDNTNTVENTGVVNIEGLSSITVRVYNEDVDYEVLYSIKIVREKSSSLQAFYDNVFKPGVAIVIILFTLFVLGLYFYNIKIRKEEEELEDEEVISHNGELIVPDPDKVDASIKRLELFKSPNTPISTDVPITTIQAKAVSLNRKKKEILENSLTEMGIEEIPDDDEPQLTKVVLRVNDEPSEVEEEEMIVTTPEELKVHTSSSKPIATKVIIEKEESTDDKLNAIKRRLKEKELELEKIKNRNKELNKIKEEDD